jgi:putative hemolysin
MGGDQPIPANPARLRLPRPQSPWMRAVVDPTLRFVERAVGLERVAVMADAVHDGDPSIPWGERVQQVTGIRPRVDPQELARIPVTGAAVVCANHPLGGADSVALLATLLSRRTDVKILANTLLTRIPTLAPLCIFVDPFGGEGSAVRNAAALREAHAWLKAGHMLAAFPGGEVSAMRWGVWTPADPPWSTIPARLALKAGAKVIPVWCEGSNSGVFHAAGLLHPRLRTALLPSEFVSHCGKVVELRVGRALATAESPLDAESLTRLVRGRCELMRNVVRTPRAQPALEPVAEQVASPDELAREFAALPADRLLFSEGGFDLFVLRAAEAPGVMEELGRLREIAFRAVGEGSGKPSDTDQFDLTYWQLVLWNPSTKEIVGGYRAGVVREVTREVGAEGLYTSTLFQFSPELFAALDESVELGRSFVRLEYQRQTMPLNLLWRGIAVFMIRNGLQQMFGPVSISNDYASMSKELIMEFLERHRLAAPFTKMVTPRNPPKRTPVASWTERETAEITSNFAQVERIVDEIERGKRAVPVLLRHYLRLNARLLAFNVDPDFGDVVDALMLVDLRQIDERIVRYYLGGDGGADDLSER